MFRDTVNSSDVRQIDFCTCRIGQFDLCLFGSFLEPLEGHRVLLEVDASVVGSELACKPLDDVLVKIITAEVRVSVG